MINKKHIWIAVIFILLGIAAFVFADGGSDKDVTEVSLYFLDKSGYTLDPIEEKFSVKERDELFKHVAEALIMGPARKSHLPIMDSSVKLNSINYVDGNIALDFSEEYPEKDYMCTYAIIKTFSKLPDVNKVQVTENEKGIIGSDGAAIGYVLGDDVNTEVEEDTAIGVHLYFANASKDQLVKEYRKINIVDTSPVEQYVVTELIEGPTTKGYQRLLASNTKVISVETTDGTCYVNFKKGFIEKNIANSGGDKLVIESVVKSLTELKNVNSVQFLVDGKKTESFGETDISEQFETEETGEVTIAE